MFFWVFFSFLTSRGDRFAQEMRNLQGESSRIRLGSLAPAMVRFGEVRINATITLRGRRILQH